MMYTDYMKFQDLNLSDDFLFSKVMGDEAVLRPVVEKILGIQIREMTIVQPQKMIEIEPDSKGIRLDIMADDEEGSRHSVEMQNENEYNINKRSRYYHSMMDLDLLQRGERYQDLRKNIVIFICTFQPFVKFRLHRYVFEKRCLQEPELALNDEMTTVILSTRGSEKDIDEEMLSFLRYMEDSRDEVAAGSEGNLVKLVHEKVRVVKQSKVREAEYMKLQERDRKNYLEGREEGIREGLEKGIREGKKEGIREGLEKGVREGKKEGLQEGKRQGELLAVIRMTRAFVGQGKELEILVDALDGNLDGNEENGAMAEMARQAAGLILKDEKLTDEEILIRLSEG